MKKNIFFLFMLGTIYLVQAQQRGWQLNLSSGLSLPISTYQNTQTENETGNPFGHPITFIGYTQNRKLGLQLNLDAAYQFGKWIWGTSTGYFSHSLGPINYNVPLNIEAKGGDLSAFYVGTGPSFQLKKGKWRYQFNARTGVMKFSQNDTLTVTFLGGGGHDYLIRKSYLTHPTTPYISGGMNISYAMNNRVEIFGKFDFFQGIEKGIGFFEHYYRPFDADRNNVIDDFDAIQFTDRDLLIEETRYTRPSFYFIGAGIRVQFGSPNNTSNQKSDKKKRRFVIREGGRTVIADRRANGQEGQNDSNNAGKNNLQESKIVLFNPENGARFDNKRKPKTFKWRILGRPFKNPVYIIEVRPANGKGQAFVGKSRKTSISAQEIFGDTKLSGEYIWKVFEQNSGQSSGYNTMFFSDCDINLSIDNVQIECLGYEGENRKYKVCFDVTYNSSSGDLTYNNTGSGLFVYDQNYTTLSYNLTSPNTNLQTQTNGSTVSYCFETTVGNNVNAINFGLQGDDLDPSPNITCQPGVSNGIDELPDCTCDDCKDFNMDTTEVSIQADPQNPSVFSLNGNLQVNTPVYGIEFQILSWNFSSNPSSCTEGVTSVETSGIFLQNGTNINNSSNIQFFNETSSGGNSNNNASLNIKYTSNAAMTGNIPFNLNIGLPQPLNGLDAGCCQIEYSVCIRITVFYEDGSCKSCHFVKCFNFNNQ